MVITSDALKEVPVRGNPNGEIYTRPIDESLTEEGFPVKGKRGRPLLGNYNGILRVVAVNSKGRLLIEPPQGPVEVEPANPLEVTAKVEGPISIDEIPPVKVSNWPNEIEVKPHPYPRYQVRPIDIKYRGYSFPLIPGEVKLKQLHFQIFNPMAYPYNEDYHFTLEPGITGPQRGDHFDFVMQEGYILVNDLAIEFQNKFTLRIGGWYIEL